MITSDELTQIKERADKAIVGPWFFDVGRKERLDRRPAVIEHFDYEQGESFIHGDVASIEDAEFIAHSREDVPRLVAEVDRLQAYIKTLKETYWNGTDYELEQLIIYGGDCRE